MTRLADLAADTSRTDPEFRALIDAYYAAWSRNAEDPQAFFARDPDAVYYDAFPPAGGYLSWDEFVGSARTFYAKVSCLDLTPGADLRVTRRGELAWTTLSLGLVAQERDGLVTSIDGRATLIWERRDGRWLIVHEHFSAPLPPPQSGDAPGLSQGESSGNAARDTGRATCREG